MMTTVEIYRKALDGLTNDCNYLKHRCAVRYGKPDYAELEEKLNKLRAKARWLQKVIETMQEDVK